MIAVTARAAGTLVDLRVTGLAPGAPVTVTRTMLGATAVVRGADATQAHLGVLVLADYEVLFGTPLLYRATSAGQNADATTVVDEDRAWLRSVLSPALSVPVMIEDLAATGRAARTTLHLPAGRRNPVAVTDTRAGRTGGAGLVVFEQADADALDTLLGSGDVLLLTAPAAWHAGPLYLVAGDVTVERVGGARSGVRRVSFDWTEVDPPPGFVVPPAQTWGQVRARGLRWTDLAGQRWVDVTHPPLRAVAGVWP